MEQRCVELETSLSDALEVDRRQAVALDTCRAQTEQLRSAAVHWEQIAICSARETDAIWVCLARELRDDDVSRRASQKDRDEV